MDNATNYTVGDNQYLGSQIVVRVTYADQHIKNVEVLQESESEDVGRKAVEEIPREIVAQNTADVDAVSGASSSSRAVKTAVKDALSKVK